jgi:hypothetical protein
MRDKVGMTLGGGTVSQLGVAPLMKTFATQINIFETA